MYIAYIVNGIEIPSGGMRVILKQADMLSERGHKVELWNYGTSQKPFVPCRADIITFDSSRLNEPDLVVLTDTYFIPYAHEERQKLGTYILVQHDYEWYGLMNNVPTGAVLFEELSDYFSEGRCKIIVVSSWLGDVMKHKYNFDTYLIRNGIDGELFYPAAPLSPSSDPTVLLLYNTQPWKDFNAGLQACLKTQATVRNLRILAMGQYIPAHVQKELTAYNNLVVLPSPAQSDLAAIYSSATVFLSASWQEGFGLPGLEAMACGAAVITTDNGGCREYVEPGINAIVVPQHDIDTMSDSILSVINNDPLRQNLIENGKLTAKRFSWNKEITLLEKLFLGEYDSNRK